MKGYSYAVPESTEDLVNRLRPSLGSVYAKNHQESHGPLALACLEWIIFALRGQVAALDIIGTNATAAVGDPFEKKEGDAIIGIIGALHVLVEDLAAVHELALKTWPVDPTRGGIPDQQQGLGKEEDDDDMPVN